MNIYNKANNIYNKLIETKIIYFLIGFSILISYYLLYILRLEDTTVLIRWGLVFNYNNIIISELLLILSIVVLISYIISRINISNRYNEEKYPILFLFFSGLIIGSLFWNIPEINPDAARFFTQAKYLEIYGIWNYFNDWGHELFAWTDFPSVPMFYGLIYRYLGEYREYIQIFNTILFSLTSVLIYKISKKLWNEEVGLYSGLLLLSFPYLLSQIPLMLVDITLMFLVTLFAFLILKIFDSYYYSFPAAFVLFLAVFTKMTSPLVIIPAISILIINYVSVKKNRNRWIFSIILSIIPIILFFYWKRDVFIAQIRFQEAFNFFPESPINYLYQLGAITIFLVILSIFVAYIKKDKNYFILIAWTIIPFIVLYDIRIRYMIPVFPFISIMASLPISRISRKDVKKFLILSLVLTSIVFSLLAYLPFEESFTDKNIKNAAEFTNNINISDVHIFLDFSEQQICNPEPFVALFDLYSHKRIVYSNDYKFYPVKDNSNSWTALFKIPSFYNNNISSDDRIIVIISDKEQLNTTLNKYLENYTLAKKFDVKTFSILNPSSVKIYLPGNYK